MRKLTVLLVLLIFTGLQAAFAQRTVTGKVAAANDAPLPGVTVVIKGTTSGTSTDGNGAYSISVPNDQTVLQFSFIGFKTQEITVGSQATINVVLEESTEELEEVVITALGIKREAKSLGYATATVNTDQITQDNSVNMGNALMGKVAGLNVTAPPTGPGGSSKLRIRGQSSFGSNNSPLIVINGVPIQNSPETTGIRADFGDGLQSINPEDVESLTVLKGATAAALYGYRAKDGVIIITTKSGAGAQGLGIEITQGVIAEQALDFTDFQYEYGQGENGVRPSSVADAQSSGGWSFGEKFDGAMTYSVDGQMHPYLPVKDRIAKFYNIGLTSNTTVAFSGGSEKGSFHFSMGRNDSKPISPNSHFDKKILDFGINYRFGKITLQSNANYSIEENVNPPGSTQGNGISNTIYTTANSVDPTWLKDPDVFTMGPGVDPATGNEWRVSRFADRTNPYWSAYQRFENRNRNRLFGNVLLKLDITEWLYIQGRVGQDWSLTEGESNTPTGQANLGPAAEGFNGGYSINKGTYKEVNSDFLIGLNKTFGDFAIDGNLGGNTMDRVTTSLTTAVTNFYIRGLYTIQNGITKNPSQDYSHKRVNSLYGTVNLSFKDYLFLNATARNDWFSTLNPKSNSYLYPSVGASFLVSEAIKDAIPTWVDYLKVRGTYAEVGGDTNPYEGTLTYNIGTNPFDGSYTTGNIANNSAPNPNLKPLKVKEAEVGLEFILFNRRLNVDLAAYNRNTVDEILDVSISNASGYGSTQVNVGKLNNKGIEALITVVPVRNRNFTWESTLNYSYNKSEVIQLAEGATFLTTSGYHFWLGGFINGHEVGMPAGSLRGYDYVRNEQGQILTYNGFFHRDPEIKTFGTWNPPHVGGWINTFKYKNYSLLVQIDGKFGHKIVSQTNYNLLREGLHKASLPGREGGVIMDGIDAETGLPNTIAVPAETFYSNYSANRVYTPFVYKGDFLKLRTITLSADLSQYVKGTFINGLSLNATVNNVLVLLSYVENLDPESVTNVSDRDGGVEQMGPPTTRTYGLTLKARF